MKDRYNKKHAVKEDLILLSYGMTVTVLAYDLALLDYWAIYRTS